MAPTGDSTVLLWRAFSDRNTPNVISIPQLIEKNAKRLRSRYLAWIYELGELKIDDCCLIDHLQLCPGFSYWWMTLVVEKCNYEKSPQINDAIRFLAFIDWATGKELTQITLVSANRPLAECLGRWCKKTNILFKWKSLSKSARQKSWIHQFYFALPRAIQALVWLLKYLIERWPMRGAGLQAWQQTTGSVTFVSYLFNLVPEAVKEGQYKTHYWGHLPEVLRGEGCKTNWLHLYVKDTILPNAKQGCDIIRTFNQTSRGMEVHVTLDSFLSLNVIYQAIKDWVKLSKKGKQLHNLIDANRNTEIYFWPLLANDWRESTFGATAMSNLLHRGLFDAALKVLPKQRIGCYLQENQGWEFALIQQWRIANQGLLVGVPHSSVRFWDLRYFFDTRCYLQNGSWHIPMPDQVALNGPAATDAFLLGGYPEDCIVQVEALRYLYLNNIKKRKVCDSPKQRQDFRLLVLGDYLEKNTRLQMNLLAQSTPSLPTDTLITVKPHPAYPVNPGDYPELFITIVTEPLAVLLADCDVVYASASTTAAVDAFCFGIPVISVLDPTILNMSPLREHSGVFYVSTPDELIKALYATRSSQLTAPTKTAVFTLNQELLLWRRLLVGTS